MLQSHPLYQQHISGTTSCWRIRPRVKNRKQCNLISCTPLVSRDLKSIPGFNYDLLSEQHTTTGYVLERLTMHLSISIAVHKLLWKKCCLFALFLHFTFINIGLVVWNEKKVELYDTFYLRWRSFCLRNMDERFHHPFTCVVTGPTNCGKTEFVAKFI